MAEHPGRIIVDNRGQRHEHGPPSPAEQADLDARHAEHEAEQAARTKARADHEAAEQILIQAARTDPVAAAIATLLGLDLTEPG